MSNDVLVSEGTLTLPVGVLTTLHYGGSEVRLYRNVVTGARQVGKRVSLLGREDTLVVQEAMLLRAIDHDNVVDVYDVAEPVGTDPVLSMYEIMMPYYELGSVFDALVKRGELFNVGFARDVAVAALRGLAHLHARHRILHRDIKPANLFLTDDRHIVKIGDLGEAMAMDDARSSSALSNPGFWTPPETFAGDRHTVASEIFSMGMTLHEMLSGPIPYDNYTIEQLSSRLEKGRCAVAPRDIGFPPHVPDSMRRIVRKATRNTATGRYEAADEMTADLLCARFIDWSWPVETGDGGTEWIGSHAGRDYRVRLRPVRGLGWRARGECRGSSGWRQVAHCQFVATDAHQAAETAFRHLANVVLST